MNLVVRIVSPDSSFLWYHARLAVVVIGRSLPFRAKHLHTCTRKCRNRLLCTFRCCSKARSGLFRPFVHQRICAHPCEVCAKRFGTECRSSWRCPLPLRPFWRDGGFAPLCSTSVWVRSLTYSLFVLPRSLAATCGFSYFYYRALTNKGKRGIDEDFFILLTRDYGHSGAYNTCIGLEVPVRKRF
jgi:hypothetical protein